MKSAIRIITCDERAATAYDAWLVWPSRIHVEKRGELRSAWEDFHEHGRPSALGRGPSANAAQHFASEHREPLELARRFARDVVAWLDREHAPHAAEGELPVFAAPRFLGQLRNAAGAGRNRFELLRGEFHALSAAQLAQEPAIEALVRRRASAPRGTAAASGAD